MTATEVMILKCGVAFLVGFVGWIITSISNENDMNGGHVSGGIILILGALLFTTAIHDANEANWQQVACSKGHAVWLVDDITGKSEWHWVDELNAEEGIEDKNTQ